MPVSLSVALAFSAVPTTATAVDPHTIVATVQLDASTVGTSTDIVNLAVTPDNSKVLVLLSGSFDVAIIDAASRQRTDTARLHQITSGSEGGLAVAPDGTYAIAITNSGWGTINKFSLSVQGPHAISPFVTLRDFEDSQDIVVAPGSAAAYLVRTSGATSSEFWWFDVVPGTTDWNRRRVASASADCRQVLISPDGRYLYSVCATTYPDAVLLKIDTSSSVITSVSFPFSHFDGAALSPDGQFLLVPTSFSLNPTADSGKFREFRTSDLTVSRIIGQYGAWTYSATAIAANQKIAYAVRLDAVDVLDLDTGQVIRTFTVPGASTVAMSPDGNYAYVGTRDGASLPDSVVVFYAGAAVPAPTPAQPRLSNSKLLPDIAHGPTLHTTSETLTCGPGEYVFSNEGTMESPTVESMIYTLIRDGKRVSTISTDDFTILPPWLVDPSDNSIRGTADLTSARWQRASLPPGNYRCEVLAYQRHSTMLWQSEALKV